MTPRTPGPWKYKRGAFNEIVGPEYDKNGGFPRDVPIATCHERRGEEVANARLIAAAPELLGALECLLEFAAYELEPADSEPNVGAVADTRFFLRQARAAITKARGIS